MSRMMTTITLRFNIREPGCSVQNVKGRGEKRSHPKKLRLDSYTEFLAPNAPPTRVTFEKAACVQRTFVTRGIILPT